MEQINSQTKKHGDANGQQDKMFIKEKGEKIEPSKDQSGKQNEDNQLNINKVGDKLDQISRQQSVIGENQGKTIKLQFLDELKGQISSQIYSQNKKMLTLFLTSLQLRALEENRQYSDGVKSVFEGDEWSNLKRQYNKKHQQTEVQEFTTKRWICDLEEEQRQLREGQNIQKKSLLSHFHYH